ADPRPRPAGPGGRRPAFAERLPAPSLFPCLPCRARENAGIRAADGGGTRLGLVGSADPRLKGGVVMPSLIIRGLCLPLVAAVLVGVTAPSQAGEKDKGDPDHKNDLPNRARWVWTLFDEKG